MPAVYIDRHSIQKATFQVQDLPYSSNAMWIIEGENVLRGGPVCFARQRHHFRLRHMATGLYIVLNKHEDGRAYITTTYDPTDQQTLLVAHPSDQHDASDGLTMNAFARLCFHQDDVHLHASGDYTAEEPVRTTVSSTDMFKEASLGTSGELQRVEITTKESDAYDDVFAIRCVRPEEKEHLTSICSMVAALERFEQYYIDLDEEHKADMAQKQRARQQELEQRGGGRFASPRRKGPAGGPGTDLPDAIRMLQRSQKYVESSKLLQSVIQVLTALVVFCGADVPTGNAPDPFEHRGAPVRKHQQMLFQQNVHCLVFKVLGAPLTHGGLEMRTILTSSGEQAKKLKQVYRLAYRLWKQMVKGAKDLALHMVQFMDFIERQLGEMTTRPDDPNVADAFMQIICDNDRLLADVSPLQLESFLWLVPQFGRKARYMTLLAACCTCDGVGLRKNQDVLVQRLRAMDHRDKLDAKGGRSEKMLLFFPTRVVRESGQQDQIQIRHLSGFADNVRGKVDRFKRRLKDGDADGYDDDSSDSKSESDGDDRPRRAQLPYMSRYASVTRSANPARALLQVKNAQLSMLAGAWVWTSDTPCVVHRWVRRWLQLHDGCLLLGKEPLDPQPRAVPVHFVHSVKKSSMMDCGAPVGKEHCGLVLRLRDTFGRLCGVEGACGRTKQLLICTQTMHDRHDLLSGLRKVILAMQRDEEVDDSRQVDDLILQSLGPAGRRGRADDDEGEDVGGVEWDSGVYIPIEQWAAGRRERDEAADGRGGSAAPLPAATTEDVRYFDQSLHFLASLCVGGNVSAIRYVMRRVPAEQVLAGTVLSLQHSLCDSVRSGYVKLAKHMFVAEGRHAVIASRPGGRDILQRLKDIGYDFMTHNSRQEVTAPSRNMLMTEMLRMLKTMLDAGCYKDDELDHLIPPLLQLLDGTSDVGSANPDRQAADALSPQAQEQGAMSPRHPGSPRTQSSRQVRAQLPEGSKLLRFQWDERVQLVMEAKLACCQLLQWLFTQAARRPESLQLRRWIDGAAKEDSRLGRHVEGSFLDDLGCDLLTQILLDITLYRGYPKLFRTALQLVFINLSGSFREPGTDDDDMDSVAVTELAGILKRDLLRGNRHLTMNMFRHFRESEEDRLTILLMRVFTKLIYLRPRRVGAAVEQKRDPKKPERGVLGFFGGAEEDKKDGRADDARQDGKDGVDEAKEEEDRPSKRHIEFMQSLLNDLGHNDPNRQDGLGITALMTQMIESPKEEVVAEALQFGHALLEGGNKKVQTKMQNYFLSLNDEAFFTCIKDRIQRAVGMIKAQEQGADKKSQRPRDEGLDGPAEETRPVPTDQNLRYKGNDLHHLQSTLRLLQLFCEGHNLELQDYLRQQADNVRSCNLVKETLIALSHLLSVEHFDDFFYEQVKQAINSLTEYCQGPCAENQKVLMANNITERVNEVLSLPMLVLDADRKPVIEDDMKDEMRTDAFTLLLSVLEGVEEPEFPKRMVRALKCDQLERLLDDVWRRRDPDEHGDTPLDLGFTAVILLRTLCPFHEPLQDWLERCAGYAFYTALTGRIEICRDHTLVRVYFRIPFICSNLSDKTKQDLLWNVRRDTPTARIADFFDRAEELIYEIEYYEKYFKTKVEIDVNSRLPSAGEWIRQIKFLMNDSIRLWDHTMIALAFLINGLVCYNYVTERDGDGVVREPLHGYGVKSNSLLVLTNVLMAVQTVVCTCLLLDYCWAKAPLIAHRADKKDKEEKKQKASRNYPMRQYIDMFNGNHPDLDAMPGDVPPSPVAAATGTSDRGDTDWREAMYDDVGEGKSIIKEYSRYYTLCAIRRDMTFLFLVASVVLSVGGLTLSPFCAAGHLGGVIHRSALLQNVIKAVTKNRKSLLLTVIMMMVVVYFFSVFGFVFFRESFQNGDPPCEGQEGCEDYHCDTLFRCFIFGVTSGLRQGGGISDAMRPADWDDPYIVARTLFDFLFFVMVIVVLLSIVFGIIIDTFAELRTDKTRLDNDIRSRCFICGIESAQFDRQADGFENHIRDDHNMWNYIFFIHFLRKKPVDEYTGQETYVHSMIEKEDMSFFPLNKALCLQGKQEEDDQQAELLSAHAETDAEVTQVERQVQAFSDRFRKENQDLRDYVHMTLNKVTLATAKRHSIMAGLAEMAREMRVQEAKDDGHMLRAS
eukprot:TRINITY_DN29632_c0_g1_i1.p1 TRINITY_DN29632_c0_g1~~TRINITY_DN29632_c0_g1_i1.p1  ORF type:complete len:2468 (+),score=1021.49 TRINITY_DN29632_c0_g1_i1:953-7405(+)